MIKVNALALNHTKYYNIREEDQPYIKEIHSAYAYEPESGTYLCELTPSYHLQYLYTYIVWANEPSEERRGELDERYCYEDNDDIYMHCSDVRKLTSKECGEFEDMEEACETLRCNWPI